MKANFPQGPDYQLGTDPSVDHPTSDARLEFLLPLALRVVAARHNRIADDAATDVAEEVDHVASVVRELLQEPRALGAVLVTAGKTEEAILGMTDSDVDLETVLEALVMGRVLEPSGPGRASRRMRVLLRLGLPYRRMPRRRTLRAIE